MSLFCTEWGKYLHHSCLIGPEAHHHAALTRRVAPRLIVGGEDPKMAATDKFLIIDGEQGARGGEELWVENHLPARKEELSSSALFGCFLGCWSGPESEKLV